VNSGKFVGGSSYNGSSLLALIFVESEQEWY